MRNLGVRHHEHASPVDVLTAQCERGFAFVPESACELLLAQLGKDVPETAEDDIDRKTNLAIECIAAIKPAMSAEDVCKAINKAFVAENPDCYATVKVDSDALSDVVDKSEAKKIAQYEIEVEKSKAKKSVVMHTRSELVPKLFKSSGGPKYTSAQKKPPRWLPEKDTKTTEPITQWIEKHAGPDVAVQCDDYNGRWRVIAPTLEWRSISWTKRGYEKAALEVIHQSWEYQSDWNGQTAPFDLEHLAKRFME